MSKEEKRNLINRDDIFKDTLYRRDKKYAHKDEDYIERIYNSRKELINSLKESLLHCSEICINKLPKEITFDFISYDRDLFRLIKNITPQKEKILKDIMYNSIEGDGKIKTKTYNVFNDIDNIKTVKDSKEYAVLIDDGINLYEGLQNRQDACIKINLLYDLNTWCKVSENIDFTEKEYEKLLEIMLKNVDFKKQS